MFGEDDDVLAGPAVAPSHAARPSGYLPDDEFTAQMDKAFGPGNWRQTGGWRSQARENALRAQGAQTVAPGRISQHSLGTPDAPGARDIVVEKLSPQVAGKILYGLGFHDSLAENDHGGQGAHLHVNTRSAPAESAAPAPNFGQDDEVVSFGAGDEVVGPKPDNWRKTRAFAGSALSSIGEAIQGVGHLADVAIRKQLEAQSRGGVTIDPALGTVVQTPEAERRAIRQELDAGPTTPISPLTTPAGKSVRAAGEAMKPQNPNLAEKIIGGVGGFVPGLGAAILNPAAGAALFGGQGYTTAEEEALAKGATPQVAEQAALTEAGIQGGLGMLPVGEVAAPLVKGVRGLAGVAARVGIKSAADAGLMGAMQVGSNINAQQHYDPKRPWYQQVPEQAAFGGLAGAGLHGIGEAGEGLAHLFGGKGAQTPAEGPGAPQDAASAGLGPEAPRAGPSLADQLPETNAIRAYMGEQPEAPHAEPLPGAPEGEWRPANWTPERERALEDELIAAGAEPPRPEPEPGPEPPVPSEGAAVIFTDPEGAKLHGKVAGVDDEGVPVVKTPTGVYRVPTRKMAVLPEDYERERIAHGGSLEQQPQAMADAVKWKAGAPKAPNLMTTLIEGGGIQTRDAEGAKHDTASILDNYRRPGLINNKGGMSPDAAREYLGERGWFGPNEAGDIDAFHELLRRARAGDTELHPGDEHRGAREDWDNLNDQMTRAGVGAADPLPVAAAKLNRWRTEQVRNHTPATDALRQRAEDLGIKVRADAPQDEILADVMEREAILKEAEGAEWDRYELEIDAALTSDQHAELAELSHGEHEWLAAAERGPRGVEGEAFSSADAALEAWAQRGGEEEAGQPRAGPEGGGGGSGGLSGQDQLAVPSAADAHEATRFDLSEAGPNGRRGFIAKPHGLTAIEVRRLLPLAERHGGKLAVGRRGDAAAGFRFKTPADRAAFMAESMGGTSKVQFQRGPVFYSAVERHVAMSPMKSAPAAQWKATIANAPGIKREELEWTGLNDWLDLFDKGEKVPKEKVEAFLRDNGVKVEEKVLGDETPDPEGGEFAQVPFNPTQFEDWKLPGGGRYRELLFTLPKEANPPATHWDTPGVMAHVRFDERVDPDGRKVLFIQEYQSDWHQKGRDQGYGHGATPQQKADANKAYDEALKEAYRAGHAMVAEMRARGELPEMVHGTPFDHLGTADQFSNASASLQMHSVPESRAAIEAYRAASLARNETAQELHRLAKADGIPDAPFKTSWPALLQKRMIRWAVDNGFDRVAWTTGEQQGERYSLTKHVGRITFEDNAAGGIGRAKMEGPTEGGTLTIYSPEGRKVMDRHIGARGHEGGAESELKEIIGADLTKRLLAAEPYETTGGHGWRQRQRHLEGLDVKIGDEGMRAFYDRNLVNITNDIIKKHGGKVETVGITNPATEGSHGGNRVERLRAAEAAYPHLARMTPRELDAHHQEFVARYNDGGSRSRAEEDAMVAEDRALSLIEDSRLHPEEYEPLQQHGFSITPKLAEAASGGFPLFKREGDKPFNEPKPGLRVHKDVDFHPTMNPDARTEAIITNVENEIARLAPFARVHAGDAIVESSSGQPLEVYGAAYKDGLKSIVLWSLESPDAVGTVRHEAIHTLKQAGLFHPDEWSALEDAAFSDGWLATYKIAARYHGIDPVGPAAVEEAIAEAFNNWRRGDRTGTGLIDKAFQRLAKLLDHVRDLYRRATGKAADARDVLSRLERGEVGRRLGMVEDSGTTRFQRAPDEGDEPPKPGKALTPVQRVDAAITHALGPVTNSVGHKLQAAALRWTPDPVRDILDAAKLGVSPMNAGSPRAQAEAKDYANKLRASAFEWGKVDAFLAKTFTPEQRTRMWAAADEHGVLLRRDVEPGPGQGLNRLTPEERAVVVRLQERADKAFETAQRMGMVSGDGLESYVPRMVVKMTATGGAQLVSRASKKQLARGGKLSVTTGQLRHRKYETVEETEVAAQAAFGEDALVVRDIRTLSLATGRLEKAIAGRILVDKIKALSADAQATLVAEGGNPDPHAFFTLPGEPALTRWHPAFTVNEATGKHEPRKDQNGDIVFEAHPVYVAREFEGPLKAVLQGPSGPITQALMNLKGKMMSVIMYNPLIHNAVIWGKAIPADPKGVLLFQAYKRGNAAKRDMPTMREAIEAGVDPIGRRFFNQDITAIAEGAQIAPGRSWTAQALAYVPGLFDKNAAIEVKRAVDQAGDVWHNTFLWDRVGDLQMGLYVKMRDEALAKGADPQSARRYAAHFANRYAGALPMEAMSQAARNWANFLMFSRSFTLGNLGAAKDFVGGLPSDVRAQITRDAGPEMLDKIQGLTRRKAAALLILDVALSKYGLMLAASMAAWAAGRAYQDPKDNEEDRKDRFLMGYANDGTALYGRLPTGKVGEEYLRYVTDPREITLAKLSPYGRLLYGVAANDKGFGRELYDPNDHTPGGMAKGLGKIAWFAAGNIGPTGQLEGLGDLMSGNSPDPKVAAMQAFLPLTGVTVSKGFPGGPAGGDLARAKESHEFLVQEAMPDIRRKLRRGQVAEANAKMTELGMDARFQAYTRKIAKDPSLRISQRKIREFLGYATPEQEAEFQRHLGDQRARRAVASQ